MHGTVNQRGPFETVRLAQNLILVGPEGSRIGQAAGLGWSIEGQFHAGFEVLGPLLVRFEAESGQQVSPPQGPYSILRIQDGYVRADDVHVATFDHSRHCWCEPQTRREWAVMSCSQLPRAT